MFVRRVSFFLLSIIVMIGLLAAGFEPFTAGWIMMVVMLTGFVAIGFMRNKKRVNLLEEQCDPEAFLERTEKQRKITGNNARFNTYLNIDRSAGLICMGKYEEAKELLLSLDKDHLSKKNGSLLVYYINLIGTLYDLNEMDEAEKLFETKISVLSPIRKRLAEAVDILIAERYYFTGKLEECKKHIEHIKKIKGLSKRSKLAIIYLMAQIDEKEDCHEKAMKKYEKVAANGNKLYIAQLARQRIAN